MATKKGIAQADQRGIEVPGIVLREDPKVYLAAIVGPWLLSHSIPSWRSEDPETGFQRIVKEPRAKEIARTVLDTRRTFPNAITLATKARTFDVAGCTLHLPKNSKFLVVDGQHRLWAQKFSKVQGTYPCIIHMDRTEQQMAALFLEINDNQRRVPSSLRWDLVRLVRSDDQATAMTADIVYELAQRKESPFYDVGIDLTGEKKELTIKQGSLAPEIKTLVNRHLKRKGGTSDFEDYLGLLIRFFVAIRSLDPEGWGSTDSTFFKARVLRALIRVLSDMFGKMSLAQLSTEKMRVMLMRIDSATLSEEAVRKAQGSAGVQDLYEQMRSQVLGESEV
jgi:DNA sulfur modification protein DndB